jgi:ABC-type nitrate/sulfonate/bicarbonate transport system substrate-binding protein
MPSLADPVSPASAATATRVAVSLGFMPLTDCAPLIVAQQEGYFAAEGLEVSLSREASWANIRDKVLVGALEGAQMIAPMPLAMSLGIATPVTPMATLLTLSVQGNTIALAQSLLDALGPEAAFERPLSAARLKAVLPELTARRGRPLTFAAVFGISTHMVQLRDWLAAGGIDPDADLRVIVVPPAQTVAQIEGSGARRRATGGAEFRYYAGHAGESLCRARRFRRPRAGNRVGAHSGLGESWGLVRCARQPGRACAPSRRA